MKNPWKFDIPVEGEEPSPTIAELMLHAKQHSQNNEYHDAYCCLKIAASSSHIPAKYHLALLCRDTPELPLSQESRYMISEHLLLDLENTLNKPRELESIYQELALLYQYKRMPISFIGYQLRLYHLRQSNLCHLSTIESSINKLDLSKLDQDPRGVGILGLECLLEPHLQAIGVYFLREAVKYGDPQGILALSLADFLEGTPSVDEDSHTLAAVYQKIAEQKGNPQLLHRHA